MSGAQTSTFGDPNILLSTLSGAQTAAVQRNQLLNQLGQQEVAANNTEVVARAASALIDPSLYPTEEARAAAWPRIIGQLKANGYAPNAPEAYPGLEHLQLTARLGTPSADLFKLGIDRQAKGAIAPGDAGTTATGGGGTGGGGGGTGTVGGTFSGDTYEAAIGGHEGLGADARLPSTVGGFRPSTWQSFVAANPAMFAGMTPEQAAAARSDPKFNAAGISWLAQQNADTLTKAGVPPSGPALGIAHYLGAGATAKVLRAPDSALIRDFVSADAVQYNPELATMTVGQLKQRYASVPSPAFLGGKPGTTATTASGAPTAPAVVTGDVARPGDVPPRPGGAPGAYPAYGGGMGAAIGGQPAAARATIPAGRPTGPPVITDQPAGSNVVAGPPGVATVGAPQPPGPAVPGNVAAINAGIAGAGGQPVTDPNLTPTPARYAGTAPAPSVEAAPQPGWGTGIGSGYGPQNALAPAPVQPAPARPATPAQPAAAQPPAADTLPPLPAPTPPAPTNRNGLTAFQQQDIERRRGMTNVSSDELQKRVDSYVATNAAVAEKYQQDYIAYVREARERQSSAGAAAHQTLEEQRQAAADAALAEQRRVENARAAETQRLAQEQATKLQQSKSDEADAERVLMAIGPKVRAGTELTPAEADQYDIARRRYARGPLQQVPDGKGGTITAFVGQEVPDRFPPLPGQKEYAGLKPIPGTEKQPDFAPANAMTAMLDIQEGNRKIVSALNSLEKYPGGVGLLRGSQPNVMSNWTDPEGVKVRADIGLVQGAIYHTLAGTAQSAQETQRLRSFVPGPTDNAEAAKVKLRNMLDNNRETLLDHYRAFGPDAGGRRQPGIEEEILSTIPPTAIDHLKENPKLAKEFDKQFGRGAAKVALQNG